MEAGSQDIFMRRCLVASILIASVWAGQDGIEAADPVAKEKLPTARQLEFFEKKIRPLLAARCFKCHGEEKVQGGLRPDSQAAFLTGGDSGEIFDPTAPQESLFLKRSAMLPMPLSRCRPMENCRTRRSPCSPNGLARSCLATIGRSGGGDEKG